MTEGRQYQAVLFDFSGVMVASPFAAMGAIGDEAGHEPDAVLELLLGPYHEDTDHPWHRLERGEISLGEYAGDLTARALDAGMDVDLGRLAGLLGELAVHDEMVERVRRLRAEGYRTALVTNNVREGSAQWRAMLPLDELFDVVVDSSEVGMRKPAPEIYAHTLELLGVDDPSRAVFLDDAAGNVEGARRAGLAAILVADPAEAIEELDGLLAGATRPAASPALRRTHAEHTPSAAPPGGSQPPESG